MVFGKDKWKKTMREYLQSDLVNIKISKVHLHPINIQILSPILRPVLLLNLRDQDLSDKDKVRITGIKIP